MWIRFPRKMYTPALKGEKEETAHPELGGGHEEEGGGTLALPAGQEAGTPFGFRQPTTRD